MGWNDGIRVQCEIKRYFEASELGELKTIKAADQLAMSESSARGGARARGAGGGHAMVHAPRILFCVQYRLAEVQAQAQAQVQAVLRPRGLNQSH